MERAVDAFPKLGQRLGQVAGTMSGGEQQMLALARAYAGEARVVLLDEVSMGLAPKLVEEIFAFLARLADEGASLLLVEQYVTKALGVARYVCLLDRGRLAFAGEPGELEREEILARYLAATPD
jgi:branched-chain amino acid transport system ATP-binding protein